jgi:hypothetical protein
VKRLIGMSLAATVLAGLTAACADQQVSITNSDSLVSSCQKVGDVAVSADTPSDRINDELFDQARSKGANWILAQPGARSGAAYRCTAPSVASR